MRLLADENIPGFVVEALRIAGYEVRWVLEIGPGIGDTEVLAMSTEMDTILLTLDKDFGSLIFKRGQRAGRGVILLRLDKDLPRVYADRVVEKITSRSNWEGHFSVIENDRIRMTPLPTTK